MIALGALTAIHLFALLKRPKNLTINPKGDKPMSCKCATFEPDEGRYQCSVSGDGCVYMIPNSKQCAEDYGEGPDAVHELSPKQRLINEYYLLKEELSHTIDMQGSLTDPAVVAASEQLNKVAVELQKMGVVM